METGFYPHPWLSKKPLIVQSGMHDSQTIKLHAVNFKQLHARRRAGCMGIVDAAQHKFRFYVTTAAMSGVLLNPRTLIHYARYAMLGRR